MVTVKVLLRVFLFALMLVDVYGVPVKGSKSQGQSRPSDSGGDVGAHQGSATGYSAPEVHSTSGGVSKPVVQYLGPPLYVQAKPLGLTPAVPGAGYAAISGIVPAQAGSVLPVQAGYVTGASEPAPAGSLLPLQAGYAAIPPQSGTQTNLPEMEWVIAPQAFEEATTNTQPQGLSIVGPPLPPAPPVPVLQSGETSNVVKEAELENYQQQMEEFGYPADHVVPGLGLPPVAMSTFGVGGLWGYPSPYPPPFPYPYFDYRLLYGLYPPGTYSTFSKNHEKGKGYFQDVHYLKEHAPDASEIHQNPGSGLQQNVFPVAP